MSRDKQIDNMAKVIARRSAAFRNPNVAFMTTATKTAESLYNAGYRKASEVAREITAEIDKRFEALLKFYPLNGEVEDAKQFVNFHWKYIKNSIMCDYDTELKKKYTEE